MPWNGSGVYTPSNGTFTGPTIFEQVEQADRDIRVDDVDGLIVDLKGALENCVTRDGQNAPTANLPMSGRRHTDVANATADNHYAAWGQTKTHVATAVTAASTPSLDALVDAASIAWDVTDKPVATVTLGGNRTLANPTNPVSGGIYTVEVVQDGTGGRTLGFGNAYSFGDEGEPVVSSAANARHFLTFIYTNSKMNMIGSSEGH